MYLSVKDKTAEFILSMMCPLSFHCILISGDYSGSNSYSGTRDYTIILFVEMDSIAIPLSSHHGKFEHCFVLFLIMKVVKQCPL